MMANSRNLSVLSWLFLITLWPDQALSFLLKAKVVPTDRLVFVGETLKMQCILTGSLSNISSSDMYFDIYSNDLENPWPDKNVAVINDTAISTDITISADRQSDKVTASCMANYTDNPLRSCFIFVEKPIRNVTNLTGTYYYDTHTLVITWSLGEVYYQPIDVTVDWNPFQPPNISGNFCNSWTNESCTIFFFGQDIIYVRIIVASNFTNKRPSEEYLSPLYQTNSTTIYQFLPYENMQTGPPTELTVKNKSSTCVTLTWSDPKYFADDTIVNGSIYKIEIKTEYESEFRVVVNSATKLRSETFVMLCDLVPNTRYYLNVRVKAKNINPWSDKSTVLFFATEEDVPLTGPLLTNTSYYVEECVDNQRKVIVYWNQPHAETLRGELANYEIDYSDRQVLVRAGTNFYTTNLNCDTDYNVHVYSATKVGRSLEPSILSIPKRSEELKLLYDLKFRVEDISNSSDKSSTVNISVTWDSEQVTDNITLTIYMCQEMYIPLTCFNDLTAQEISLGKNGIKLNDLSSLTSLFGFALSDGGGRKQGIQWTDCVYNSNNIPGKPAGLRVSAGSKDGSLLISWTSTQCNKATKVLIIKYHLFICTQPSDKPLLDKYCQSITIDDLSKSSYTAMGLEGDKTYQVYIQAESPTQLGSFSNAVEGVPKSSDFNKDEVVGISAGVVTGVFILGFLLFCVIKFCRDSKMRVGKLINHGMTRVPSHERIICQNSNNESGFGSASPSNSPREKSSISNDVPDSNNAVPCDPPPLPARPTDLGIPESSAREIKSSTSPYSPTEPDNSSPPTSSAEPEISAPPYLRINVNFSSGSSDSQNSSVTSTESYTTDNVGEGSTIIDLSPFAPASFNGPINVNVVHEPRLISQAINISPPVQDSGNIPITHSSITQNLLGAYGGDKYSNVLTGIDCIRKTDVSKNHDNSDGQSSSDYIRQAPLGSVQDNSDTQSSKNCTEVTQSNLDDSFEDSNLEKEMELFFNATLNNNDQGRTRNCSSSSNTNSANSSILHSNGLLRDSCSVDATTAASQADKVHVVCTVVNLEAENNTNNQTNTEHSEMEHNNNDNQNVSTGCRALNVMEGHNAHLLEFEMVDCDRQMILDNESECSV